MAKQGVTNQTTPARHGAPQKQGSLTTNQRRRQQATARSRERSRVAQGEVAIASSGSQLALRGNKLIITRGRKQQRVCRLDRLQAVTVAGHGIGLSTDLIVPLARAGIPLFITGQFGRPVATLTPVDAVQGERVAQQAIAGVGRVGVQLAMAFLDGKLRNSAGLLRVRAKHAVDPALRDTLLQAKQTMADARRTVLAAGANAERVDSTLRAQLMGHEGHAARVYWQAIAAMLGADAGFPGRRHRGAAHDAVNCCLNYGYGVLYQRIERAVILAGLSPRLGFLHVAGPKRVGLVWDLIEEHRAFWIDKVVTAMVSRHEPMALNGARLDEATRRRLLGHVLGHLGATTVWRGEHRTFDEVLAGQLADLAKALAGEGSYRPFVARW